MYELYSHTVSDRLGEDSEVTDETVEALRRQVNELAQRNQELEHSHGVPVLDHSVHTPFDDQINAIDQRLDALLKKL